MSSMETPEDPDAPEPTDKQMNTSALIFFGNVILLIIVAAVLLPS